jgi:hypothetical protein
MKNIYFLFFIDFKIYIQKMLIFARIILVLMIFSAVVTGLLQLYSLTQGSLVFGGVCLLFTGVLLWLEYTNFVDATACANKAL